jgi:hypothetical protein
MKARAAILALILLLASVAPAAERFSITIRSGYFQPSDQIFRTIYGGGISWQAEGAIAFLKVLELWAGAGFFAKDGHMIPTGERTSVWLVPAGGGIRYVLRAGNVSFYGGAGILRDFFRESNAIGKVSWGRWAPQFEAGSRVPVKKRWFLDLHVQYSTCRMKPVDLEFNVGGFSLAAGIGVRFE